MKTVSVLMGILVLAGAAQTTVTPAPHQLKVTVSGLS
jgi:hypothetical protein